MLWNRQAIYTAISPGGA